MVRSNPSLTISRVVPQLHEVVVTGIVHLHRQCAANMRFPGGEDSSTELDMDGVFSIEGQNH